MRQAGRSLPEYRAIRERHSFFEVAGTPELCAEVTLQPVRRHGVDAAVLFADIMSPVLGMGLQVELVEGVGPVIERPIATSADVERLRVTEPDEEFVAPHSARVLAALDVPTIHFGTGVTEELLGALARAGGTVIGLDWRIPLDVGWAVVGEGRGVQGNLDPAVLLASWERVEEAAYDVLSRAGGRPGHIFNLGHGVLPETDPAVLTQLAGLV